jgi:hypothetical protein
MLTLLGIVRNKTGQISKPTATSDCCAADTPETELARKSDAELFENLQARAAALGFTIERIRPQLTLVDGSKQDERA